MPQHSVSTSIDVSTIPATRQTSAIALLLVAVIAIAFTWPTRNGDFLSGDDQRLLLSHVFVNHPSWHHAVRLLTIFHDDLYQPLPMLSFQLNYAEAAPHLTGAFAVSPYGFHLTNILLHAANAVLVALVAVRLAGCRRIGIFTGLLFACHPFALEPVAWINGRMILLATMFSLLMFLGLPLRAEKGQGSSPILATLAWLLSLTSKVFPTVPLAAVWCDRRRHGSLSRRRWITYAVMLAMSGAATWMVYRATNKAGFIEGMQSEAVSPMPVRVLLAARYYVENYFRPNRLAAWSPPPRDIALFSAPVGLALLELAALFLSIVATWRRRPVSCTGLVLFVILLTPFLAASGARRFLAADRYMYLPIVGLHLAVASTAVALFDRLRTTWNDRAASMAVGLPCLAVLAAWMTVGWRLAPTWADSVARDRRVVEVYPDDELAHVELAKAHVYQKDAAGALSVVSDARRRWPDSARLAAAAGEAYRLSGDFTVAEAELRLAVARMPQHVYTRYLLAQTLEQLAKIDEARDSYRRIFSEQPTYYPAIVALARSYEKYGDSPKAIDAYQKAIAINPYDPDALLSLAILQIRQHQWNAAEPLLRSILELDPNDPSALLNLGVVLARTDRAQVAIEIYDRLIAADSDNLTARINRAALFSSLGRSAEAVNEFRSILEKNPDLRAAVIGLHEALQSICKYQALVDLWREYAGTSISEHERSAWLGWSLVLTGDSQQAVNNALALPPDSEARDFARWTMAYLALTRKEARAIPDTLGAPKPPSIPSAKRQEWLHVVAMGLAALPPALRDSPAGLYLLARMSLENGNPALAEQAARRVIQETDNESLKKAADAVLKVIAESRAKSPSPTTTPASASDSHPPDGFAG